MSKQTKNTFATSMFDKIRESLKNEKKGGNSSFRDIMKFEQGKTYLIRIIPNLKNPELTFFHYYSHGWNSLSTGQYVSALCPFTYGESCPIDAERYKIWRNGTEDEKETAKNLKRKENWLMNVYVISDPSNPENEGKVKMVRYGKQLHQIIDSAINGDDADEFGAKIFDLSENGCTLRVKVESNSEGKRSWATYVASRFLSPSAIPGMTEEKMDEVYNSVFDLEKLEDRKSTEQLQELIDVHYYVKIGNSTPPVAKTKEPSFLPAEDETDEIPGVGVKSEEIDTDDIDKLLKDL